MAVVKQVSNYVKVLKFKNIVGVISIHTTAIV